MLIEREVSASWAGRPLGDIEIPGVARAVAVSRMGAAQIATPDLVTQDGDLVYLAVAIGHVSEVDEHLGGAASGRGVHT
jgi:Trk K+ transport system NAD-binding subunit